MIGVAHYHLEDSHGLPVPCNVYGSQYKECTYCWEFLPHTREVKGPSLKKKRLNALEALKSVMHRVMEIHTL